MTSQPRATRPVPADAATWWTVPEAAQHLKVSENAVYAAIRAGQLPVLHIGTQPRVSPLALVEVAVARVRRRPDPAPEEAPTEPPTRAPTALVTDRRTPKHIGTGRRRPSPNAAGSR